MSDYKAESDDTTILDLLMHLQQDTIAIARAYDPYMGKGMDDIAMLRRNAEQAIEALLAAEVTKAKITELEIVMSKGIVSGWLLDRIKALQADQTK